MSNGRGGRTRDHQLVPMSGPPVQSFPSKRVCVEDGCATVLSIYNGTAFCSLHEPIGRWEVEHGALTWLRQRRGGRTPWDGPAYNTPSPLSGPQLLRT